MASPSLRLEEIVYERLLTLWRAADLSLKRLRVTKIDMVSSFQYVEPCPKDSAEDHHVLQKARRRDRMGEIPSKRA